MKCNIQTIRTKYEDLISLGYTTRQISQDTNIPLSTVKRQLKILGLKTIHSIQPIVIDKNDLELLISQGLSTYAIADKFNVSQTTIRYWLKKYKLKSEVFTNRMIEIKMGLKTCPQCKLQLKIENNFYKSKSGKIHSWCKKCNNKITYDKQKLIKIKAIEYKGGKCIICGYSKYVGALDFHHLNPEDKDFDISSLRSYTWEIIKNELDKCVCVCRNCHSEIHGGKLSV